MKTPITEMLTDKRINEIAQPFIRVCGGYGAHEDAIPYRDIEDFARAIEKAVQIMLARAEQVATEKRSTPATQ